MQTSLSLEHRFADRRRRDAASYRKLLILTFPVFWLAALLRLPLAAAGLVVGDGRRLSVFGRAKAMAHTVIPWCFMG